MEKIYYEVAKPASFSSVSKLQHALRREGRQKNPKAIKQWLSEQPVYTLHRAARRKYPRAPIIVRAADDQWELDLVEMIPFAKYNQGYKYILTCIDVLSKFAWASSLKNKSACEVKSAFENILKSTSRRPRTVRSDQGKEFINSTFRQFCIDNGILTFQTNSEQKAAIVERWNRTLKSKMWRYFTHMSTLCWLDVLSDLVHSYNCTYHRSIKMAPADVCKENESEVWMNLYDGKAIETIGKLKKAKFSEGQAVRISNAPRLFKKGYKANWSEEVYTVVSRAAKHYPYMYKIRDMRGEEIRGLFHEHELQAVPDSQRLYVIEKILKTEKRKGKIRYLVKWAGYDATGWVDEKDLRKV